MVEKYIKERARCKGLIGLISAMAVIFSVLVYTSEYNLPVEGEKAFTLQGIKPFLDFPINITCSLLLLLIVAIVSIIVILIIRIRVISKYIDDGEKIEEYKDSIDVLKEKLVSNITSTIQQDTKDKIVRVIETFLSNYSNIISIQLYECLESRNKTKIIYEIKPTPYQKTREGQVANLIHEKYSVSESLISRFEEVKDGYNKGNSKVMVGYIRDLTNQLAKKSKNKNRLTEDALNKYSLLTLSTQYFLNDVSFKIDSIDPVYVEELNKMKRTGFLRGILHGKYYKFLHHGDSYKGKRIYITKCLSIESRKHMFVIILTPEEISKDGLGDYLDEIGGKFYKLLSDETKLVYNEVKQDA